MADGDRFTAKIRIVALLDRCGECMRVDRPPAIEIQFGG